MNTQDAIDHFGTIQKLAKALDIKHVQSIYQWNGKVPRGRQYELQLLTKGKLKAEPKNTTASSAA